MKGIDVTDQGYWISQYHFFFYSDKVAEASALLWLTMVIGSGVDYIFGNFGLICFRIAYVFLLYSLMSVTYKICIHKFDKYQILSGLLVALIFSTYRNSNILSYDNIPVLFNLISIGLLISGIEKNNRVFIIFCGFVLGANIFVKITSVSGIFLCSICLIGTTYSWRTKLRNIGLFLLGMSAGVIIVSVMMAKIGHLTYFINSIQTLIEVTDQGNNPHTAGKLIKGLIFDFGLIFKYFIPFSLLMVSISSRCKGVLRMIGVIACLSIVALFDMRELVHCVSAAVFVGLLREYYVHNENRTIVLAAFILLIISPLGSGVGFTKARFALWLPTVVAFCSWFDCVQKMKLIQLRYDWVKALPVVILILGIYVASVHYYSTPRRDANRKYLTSELDIPRARDIWTSPQRKKVLEGVVTEICLRTDEKDEILVYDKVPMLHYLTDRKPYLGLSWPFLYPYKRLVAKLGDTDTANGIDLPLVVRPVYSTSVYSWPIKKKGLVMKIGYPEKRAAVSAFLRKNNYTVSWSNDFFEILESTSNK